MTEEHIGILKDFLLIILGLVATIALIFDLKTKTKILQDECDVRKKIFENIAENLKSLSNIGRYWFEEQRIILEKMTNTLTAAVADRLATDGRWATQALEQARLGPYSESLFGYRRNHWRNEKDFIARNFVPFLLARCKHIVENNKQPVYLILDSGTTIFPFFERIANFTTESYNHNENWVKTVNQLTLATNNLPGLESMMEHGRVSPSIRYSPLIIKDTRVLPGTALPVYWAATGRQTIDALDKIKEEASQRNAIVIGVVTGNWIRIEEDNSTPFPVPQTRGEGHLEFKQKIISISDEAYIIAPLGKVFVDVTNDKINEMFNLNFDDTPTSPKKNKYQEVCDKDKASFIKMISTVRSRNINRVLHDHGRILQAKLRVEDKDILEDDAYYRDEESRKIFMETKIEYMKHILFTFDNLPTDRIKEEEIEFPHHHTWGTSFKQKYFQVT